MLLVPKNQPQKPNRNLKTDPAFFYKSNKYFQKTILFLVLYFSTSEKLFLKKK